MTRDDVLRLAREAGLSITPPRSGQYDGGRVGCDVVALSRFAALVSAAEREACAVACETEASRALFNWSCDIPCNQGFWNGAEQIASGCADVIRARGVR